MTDSQLLELFAEQGQQSAFETLIQRYGPTVLGVGRRVLHDRHAAEDIFQATFLVLARKAPTLDRSEPVGGWLYTVAFRLALKAKAAARRQNDSTSRIGPPASQDPLAELTAREFCTTLDKELQRLPAVYRQAMLACLVEGQSRAEVARRLGLSQGQVKARLERGRGMLRRRLARRGISLSAALLAAQLLQSKVRAARSALVQAVLRGATAKVAHSAIATGPHLVVSALLKTKVLSLAIVVGTLITGGVTLVTTRQHLSGAAPAGTNEPALEPDVLPNAPPGDLGGEPETSQGRPRYFDPTNPPWNSPPGPVRNICLHDTVPPAAEHEDISPSRWRLLAESLKHRSTRRFLLHPMKGVRLLSELYRLHLDLDNSV